MMNDLVLERFWEKVEVKQNGCWNWKAGKNSCGYGGFRHDNKMVQAHRFSYELVKGKIPVGLELDHLCRNRKCVNPEHLEAVLHRENVLRGENEASKNSKKTHCKKGHPFSGENLYVWKNKMRHCRECDRINQIKYRQNKKSMSEVLTV